MHMMTVHEATHFFRDITEMEIRIMTLLETAMFNEEMLKGRPAIKYIQETKYSCGCVILPEELGGGCDEQKLMKRTLHNMMADHIPINKCSRCSVFR